jgi:hypothetical protein
MITIEKKTIENYENSYSYQIVVNYDYVFERDILEKHLSQALEESKIFFKKIIKGEKDFNGN